MILIEALGWFALSWVLHSQIMFLKQKFDIKKFDTICLKCFTFWFSLISLNIFVAAIAALMAYFFDNYFSNISL